MTSVRCGATRLRSVFLAEDAAGTLGKPQICAWAFAIEVRVQCRILCLSRTHCLRSLSSGSLQGSPACLYFFARALAGGVAAPPFRRFNRRGAFVAVPSLLPHRSEPVRGNCPSRAAHRAGLLAQPGRRRAARLAVDSFVAHRSGDPGKRSAQRSNRLAGDHRAQALPGAWLLRPLCQLLPRLPSR